jgi:hypothetical protein
MLPPCYKCGTVYDGDRCATCAARIKMIEKPLYLYAGGLTVGFCAILVGLRIYPPLNPYSLDAYLLPILIVIPLAVMIVLAVCDQTEQFAVLAGLMFVLAGAVLPCRAAFYLLNGALDRNPPVEIQTVVLNGDISNDGESGSSYGLVVSVPWNQRKFETVVDVSSNTYSFAETGDSLRLAIHPGAFHMPWYRPFVLSDDHREIRFAP